jgi:ATP-dependent Clp protease ATP-binding subunit ClpC
MDQNNFFTGHKGMGRLTDNARSIIVFANELAAQYRNPEILPLHLFLAIIKRPSELVSRIFEQTNLDLTSTIEAIQKELGSRSQDEVKLVMLSPELKTVINKSFVKAEKLRHVYVGIEHILLALIELDDEPFVKELVDNGLTTISIEKYLSELGNYLPGILSNTENGEAFFEDDIDESSLPFFCKDMNDQASSGDFLNITGRDEQIERMIHILSRKTKNNPILVGDAGVGKTAVVQGFVQKILKGDVPASFLNKQVLSLDVASILAGARVRGDVEERILSLVNEAIESGDKIIFIDEIHMIVGAGSSGGKDSMDIGNILKPYLTDPRLRIIGATTVDEYRRNFDDDPALSRRFQPIDIEEIDKKSAISILKNLKKDFEKYHSVKIREDALIEAVNLSSKFITDRYLPDKAIDLIDEAAASVKIGREINIEPELAKLGEKLINVQQKKQAAITNSDMQKASKYKKTEEAITDDIEKLVDGSGNKSHKNRIVTSSLIQKIVVNWTKIPLAAGSTSNAKLKSLYGDIRKRVVGQDHVLEGIVEALKRSHLGLTDQKRPLASFLFLGPTGVGKTQLAKTIASELFGSEDLLVQINMSEYMEQHSVAKLIGSPPGYVGFQEGGQLTEMIRRRPYSVVLFDEIEKAHPEVLNLLLQILEEGELKDGRGRRAVFKNTVVILTSNIGAQEVSQHKKLGFNIDVDEVEEEVLDQAFAETKNDLLESLQREVRPEILNRLDDIAIFRGFGKNDCLQITKVLLDELCIRLLQNGVSLELDPKIYSLVNEEGYSKQYGARNIRRKIQDLVENGLANYMISKGIKRPKKGILKVTTKIGKDGNILFDKEK